ncbi:MAG TPA: RNB domain-containing ribonuclease [Polyangiaceae bacterium LLY-WYZ-15_(1-7)]|nr:RNB domain-containing ribonuclease [Polyangiaceae bacterium LLY-WYZ-15_(1-7)]HJL24222.1 RNB domain-containing ribonuclease [Polyangiaceae bacterium LLY-WYZ-15_(1-7)]HJL33795.1 RNB domain-containing ribonuclease [Polyangiaceae bacterium LLY-WYZ-15_(1-7)]HJL47266.1 RNB domain-containing ribonuclease [Polyangiaceae bacterium LLY-WYZ-15_(1-7)]
MPAERLAAVIDPAGGARPLLDPDASPRPVDGPAPPAGAVVLLEGARVLETLAPPGSAKAALYALAARRGLDPVFPAAVRAEVAALERDPSIDDPALVDRTDLPFVTIDGATSRDLDQALFIAPEGAGHVVHYALADASHYCRPGTALFDEALRRGASFYLPGLMIPMLPRALSEGLVSLNPEVERRALSFVMRLDAEGRVRETRVERARIRSRAKLDWGGVQAFYDGGPGFGAAIDASLEALAEVGRRRMALAEARGVVRYRRSEVAVKLAGAEGLRFVVLQDVRRPVERYNEQLSLLCNVEGAKRLEAAADDAEPNGFVEPIFRVHPAPDAARLADFEAMLDALVESHDLDPAVWRWRRDEGRPLAAYLDALPREGRLGRLARAVHRQAVMVNVRSVFQTEAAGHHGVGAEVYARFSAPMREIVGVYLHLELAEALRGEGRRDEALRERVVKKANSSKHLQRALTHEANRLVLDQVFARAEAEGGELAGTVMGLARGKVYVLLDEPPIDVKVYLRHQKRFAEAPLEMDPHGTTLRSGDRTLCRLGDAVRVRVRGKDAERDRWILTLVP